VAWHENLRRDDVRDEAALIVRAFADRGIDIGGVVTQDGEIGVMYATDRLLAREQYLGEAGVDRGPQDIGDAHRRRSVLDILRQAGVTRVEVRRVIRDVVVVLLNPEVQEEPRREEGPEGTDATAEGSEGNPEGDDRPIEGERPEPPEGERPDALFLVERIQEEFGPRVVALDTLMTAAQGHPSRCPATEPQETYDPHPYPPVCPGNGGDGVRIYVADTGIVQDTVTNPDCPWLAGVTGDDDPNVAPGAISPYGGHGTFVAGVIRCMAPGSEIVVKSVFDTVGSALESEFVPKLYEGFAFGAEIFHITVASPTMGNLPLMAFEAWMEDLHQYKGVACVVPAGNSDSRLPYWPAAFPGMISVGALATDWRSRAYFSDYGGWVDVYAPGENLVNGFARGLFKCQVAPYAGEERTFSGMAQWSGTSFSSPIVTGLIAARMTRCGESAKDAAAALLAKARAQAIPGVGPVLFPDCDGDERCRRCGGRGGHCGCRGDYGHGHGCGCGAEHGCGGGCGAEHGCGGGCGAEHGCGGGCGCRR
jgi:Subtilase family